MTISSQGYDGALEEQGWATIIGRHAGVPVSALGVGDWAVTAVSGVDRTVSVAADVGELCCGGVLDTGTAAVTVAGTPVSTGVRWDLVSALHDWTYTDPAHTDPTDPSYVGGRTTVQIITGGSTPVLPSGRATALGVTYDAPLALVQFTAGISLPTAIIDLRVRVLGGVAHVASPDAATILGIEALLDERASGALPLMTMQQLVGGADNYTATTISAPAVTASGTATYTVTTPEPLVAARVALGSGLANDSGGQPGALLDVTTTSGQAMGIGFSYSGVSPFTHSSLANSGSLGTLRATDSNGITETITDCYLSGSSLIVVVNRTWATGYTLGASSIPVVIQGRS